MRVGKRIDLVQIIIPRAGIVDELAESDVAGKPTGWWRDCCNRSMRERGRRDAGRLTSIPSFN